LKEPSPVHNSYRSGLVRRQFLKLHLRPSSSKALDRVQTANSIHFSGNLCHWCDVQHRR